MAATYCGSSAMSDSKVEIIARLAQWRIENFGPCSTRRSDAFKIGIWNCSGENDSNSEDFVWAVEATFPGRFVIDVEFLDLKIPCSSGSEHYSVFPNGEAVLQAANDGGLSCLSRMLEEEIHSDVTINTNGGGALKAHKAVLSACSPVFESMFLLDLKEKESSLIDIEDMSFESCSALLRYIYGAIDQNCL
ncbi:hypothetical protein HPP92_011944 [Vanilla planifolia]|uniref:BTB domain-containing protein n=1 Tax=Vanilla planifolia TaxID=51239 RepID=A0A835QWM8_VANPL|nr:hypothetical protein HPP92_011944 [Vanilla planifolia]